MVGIENGKISPMVTNLMGSPSLSKPVYWNTDVPTPTFSEIFLVIRCNFDGVQVDLSDSPVLINKNENEN